MGSGINGNLSLTIAVIKSENKPLPLWEVELMETIPEMIANCPLASTASLMGSGINGNIPVTFSVYYVSFMT